MNAFAWFKRWFVEFGPTVNEPAHEYDLDRVMQLFAAASEQLRPGERRVTAFEGTIGPPITWLTQDLLEPFQAWRLFALTEQRLFALRISRLTDRARGLAFSDSRHSLMLVSHTRPAGAKRGRIRIRRGTGKIIGVNYERIWAQSVEPVTRWLARGSGAR